MPTPTSILTVLRRYLLVVQVVAILILPSQTGKPTLVALGAATSGSSQQDDVLGRPR